MTSFRVLIVDDHLLVRKGLKRVLAEEYLGVVFGEAATGDEALAEVGKQPWDLVVLDVGIAGKDGFYVLQETLSRQPATSVLILSIQADTHHTARALQMGASGCVCKDAGRPDVVEAFRDIIRAQSNESLSPGSTAPLATGHASLSAREYEVLLAFAAGKRTGEIAAEFNLNIKTVSTYKRRIRDKLRLKSTADLVHYVIAHRIS